MTTDNADALMNAVAAGAHMLDLTLDPAWLPSVRANLEVSLRLGKLVDEFPLPDDHEPASHFKA
ncbi:DUF4089 domain-containing protein [Bradyrhizobium sp. LHD-71]|nr:DUF4089 domain-containing protein [Bradyrhizobium sp. LHD-71]MDQ8732106.1 DUF4089 domain-containing protein [Bradyrhizobium sp. LHD-71]